MARLYCRTYRRKAVACAKPDDSACAPEPTRHERTQSSAHVLTSAGREGLTLNEQLGRHLGMVKQLLVPVRDYSISLVDHLLILSTKTRAPLPGHVLLCRLDRLGDYIIW